MFAYRSAEGEMIRAQPTEGKDGKEPFFPLRFRPNTAFAAGPVYTNNVYIGPDDNWKQETVAQFRCLLTLPEHLTVPLARWVAEGIDASVKLSLGFTPHLTPVTEDHYMRIYRASPFPKAQTVILEATTPDGEKWRNENTPDQKPGKLIDLLAGLPDELLGVGDVFIEVKECTVGVSADMLSPDFWNSSR